MSVVDKNELNVKIKTIDGNRF